MKQIAKLMIVAAVAAAMAAPAWATTGDIVDIRVVDTDMMKYGERKSDAALAIMTFAKLPFWMLTVFIEIFAKSLLQQAMTHITAAGTSGVSQP